MLRFDLFPIQEDWTISAKLNEKIGRTRRNAVGDCPQILWLFNSQLEMTKRSLDDSSFAVAYWNHVQMGMGDTTSTRLIQTYTMFPHQYKLVRWEQATP